MKTAASLFVSLVSAAAAVGIAVVGCGTTNNIDTGGGTSEVGESCTRTFDCKKGLVCEGNVCFPGANPGDGGAGDGGEGGVAIGPHLGLLNHACQTSSDCQSPLACLGGSCSIVDYMLTSTGKSCSGECNTVDDCCELPVNFSLFLSSWDSAAGDGGYAFHPGLSANNVRCEDILAFLGGSTAACSDPTATVYNGVSEGCFFYDTYCKCAPNTWSCTNNTCAYTTPCTVSSTSIGGCPSETRAARGLSSTCSIVGGATTGTCQAGCATAADCSGKFPSGTGHACSAADAGSPNCTCYQSACYFKCSRDVDCASGSTCDPATSLCKASGCTTDANCIQASGNPRGKCVSGACQTQCANDTECNPPSSICSSGFCKASGCSSDPDCALSGNTHLFCVTAAPTAYTSAVTN